MATTKRNMLTIEFESNELRALRAFAARQLRTPENMAQFLILKQMGFILEEGRFEMDEITHDIRLKWCEDVIDRVNEKAKASDQPALDTTHMQWTTDKPHASGCYWAYNIKGLYFVKVQKSLSENEPDIVLTETTAYSLRDFTHWIGPIQEPDPPAEFFIQVI